MIGTQCIKGNGYFFKTPTNNATLSDFEVGDASNSINLSSYNPLSLTIWIKIFGASLDAIIKPVYSFLGFYSDPSSGNKNYLGFDNTNKRIVLNIKNNNAFNTSDAANTFGKWSHFGISIHSSMSSIDKFPNMINLMINKDFILPQTTFDMVNTVIGINKITLSNDITALYSNLRLYNQFIIGTYSLGVL